MNKILKLVFTISFHVAFSQKITLNQAINITGKESMLIQRMAKDKIFLSNNQNVQESKKELASSVILFERNLEILKKGSLSSAVKKDLTHIELLWIGYKKNIVSEQNTSYKILEYNNIVLEVSNQLSEKFLKMANRKKTYPYNTDNTKITHAVLAANSIKHLSQRLALYYGAYFFGEKKYNGDNFDKIINSIEKNILAITEVKETNQIIKQKTEDIIFQWKNIKAILEKVVNEKFISKYNSPKPEIIFEECNRLLSNSDMLSRTYISTSEINKK